MIDPLAIFGPDLDDPLDIFGLDQDETEEERRRRKLEQIRRNLAIGEEQAARMGIDEQPSLGTVGRRVGRDVLSDLAGMGALLSAAGPAPRAPDPNLLALSERLQESRDIFGGGGGPERERVLAASVGSGASPVQAALADTALSAAGAMADPLALVLGAGSKVSRLFGAARRTLRPVAREAVEEAAPVAARAMAPAKLARLEETEALADKLAALELDAPAVLSERIQAVKRLLAMGMPEEEGARLLADLERQVARYSPPEAVRGLAETTQRIGTPDAPVIRDVAGEEALERLLGGPGRRPGPERLPDSTPGPRTPQEPPGEFPGPSPAQAAADPAASVASVAERGQRLLTQPALPKLRPGAELAVAKGEGGYVATEGFSDWLVKNFTPGAGSIDPRGNVYAMVARDFVDPRIRRYLSETLPRSVEGARSAEREALRQMSALSKEIDQASARVAKASGGRVTAAQLRRQMDDARRAGDYSTLPPELQPVAQRTGEFVDNLSRRYIDEGLAGSEETAETIAGNLGRYLNTSHAAFDRPGFLAEVRGTKAWDEARAFFKSEIPDASEEEIVGLLERLADRKQGRPLGFGKRSTGVGRKDLKNLLRREEIPEPVRELLGVYRDYKVNFERSTARMAHALAEHRLLREVSEELQALGVVRQPSPVTGRGEAGFYREIVGGPERSPLSGLYTTPRVAEVLEGVMEASRSNWFTYLSGAIKFGKVGLSPQTQARNFESGFLMSVANGNFLGNPRHLWDSAKAQGALIRQVRAGGPVLDAELGRAVELGVVGRGANSREFLSYMDEIGQGPRGLRKLVENKPMGYVGRAYMAGDDFWKFANWKQEVGKLDWGYGKGSVPRDVLEREAAEIVSQQLQTYDRAIPLARKLSRNPIVSPFVTFHAEMPRNLVNILRRSATEYGRAKAALAAGDQAQALRWAALGTQRLVGMGAALSLFGAYKTYRHREMNLTGDKEEAFRRLALPDYAENSQAIVTSIEGDEVTYFDSQFADPYNVVQRLWVAAIARPGDPEERLLRVSEEMADTFLGPEVLAGTAAGLAFNRDIRTDREITRDSRPRGRRIADRSAYVARGLAPGGALTAERLAKAAAGEEGYDLGREAIAVVGPRWRTVNLRDSFGRKVLEFNKARQEIAADFRAGSTDRSGNDRSPDEMLAAQKAAEASWKRNWETMQGFVRDGQNWGWSDREIVSELREHGIRADLARALVAGRYTSYAQYRRNL